MYNVFNIRTMCYAVQMVNTYLNLDISLLSISVCLSVSFFFSLPALSLSLSHLHPTSSCTIFFFVLLFYLITFFTSNSRKKRDEWLYLKRFIKLYPFCRDLIDVAQSLYYNLSCVTQKLPQICTVISCICIGMVAWCAVYLR